VLFGWRRLLATRTLWLIVAALLGLFLVSCFWRPRADVTTNLITAAKIVEYALLAPALVLLFRSRLHVDRFLVAFNQRFDAPIREIFRVAVNPFGGRARSSEHPEADALHTSANENPPGDDHKRPL